MSQSAVQYNWCITYTRKRHFCSELVSMRMAASAGRTPAENPDYGVNGSGGPRRRFSSDHLVRKAHNDGKNVRQNSRVNINAVDRRAPGITRCTAANSGRAGRRIRVPMAKIKKCYVPYRNRPFSKNGRIES